MAARRDCHDRVSVAALDVGQAFVGRSPRDTQAIGELGPHLGASEIASCGGVCEEASGIDGACLAEAVGRHVRNHDVLVELGLKGPIGVVPIGGCDHVVGDFLVAVAPYVESLSLDVVHSGGDGSLYRFVDRLTVLVRTLRIESGHRLGCRPCDIESQHYLRLFAVGCESIGLRLGNDPAASLILGGVEVALGRFGNRRALSGSSRLLRSKLGGLAGEPPDVGIIDSCDGCHLSRGEERIRIGGQAQCSMSCTPSTATRTTCLEELLARVRVLAEQDTSECLRVDVRAQIEVFRRRPCASPLACGLGGVCVVAPGRRFRPQAVGQRFEVRHVAAGAASRVAHRADFRLLVALELSHDLACRPTGLASTSSQDGDAYVHCSESFRIHYLWAAAFRHWDTTRAEVGSQRRLFPNLPVRFEAWERGDMYLPKQVRRDLRLCLRFFRSEDRVWVGERIGD